MPEVQFGHIHLPLQFRASAVLDDDGQVTPRVISSQLGDRFVLSRREAGGGSVILS